MAEHKDMQQKAGDGSTQYQSGGDMTINNHKSKTRLSTLFKKLTSEFNEGDEITHIIDELQSYTSQRDIIGLEQKLIDGNRSHLFDAMSWYKQEYAKKLEKFQFYPSAQKIHSIVLAIVLDKFSAHITPMINQGADEAEISKKISEEVVTPIFKIIEEEGFEDIMGLTMSDINGMVYYLTGKCHIKWN